MSRYEQGWRFSYTAGTLEKTLTEVSCALFLVSHDEMFLAALTTRRWDIDRRGLLTIL